MEPAGRIALTHAVSHLHLRTAGSFDRHPSLLVVETKTLWHQALWLLLLALAESGRGLVSG